VRLLDLFCCEGGAGEGYRLAGFDVTGVDIEPKPRNPHTFVQADALEYVVEHGHEYDAIHASPPCQAHSSIGKQSSQRHGHEYPDLIAPTRAALIASGKPYVMENVIGAPMQNHIMLCGSSFGLDVRRHRLFECSFPILAPPCAHHLQTPRFRSLDKRHKGLAAVVGVHGHINYAGERAIREAAMGGIDWMSDHGLAQAIPPAYTEHIGGYLMAALNVEKAA
jgi:DNA (cytosine-5)-methyltransferase 1